MAGRRLSTTPIGLKTGFPLLRARAAMGMMTQASPGGKAAPDARGDLAGAVQATVAVPASQYQRIDHAHDRSRVPEWSAARRRVRVPRAAAIAGRRHLDGAANPANKVEAGALIPADPLARVARGPLTAAVATLRAAAVVGAA